MEAKTIRVSRKGRIVLSKKAAPWLTKTGIYEIVCSKSGLRYVGSASTSFQRRWRMHLRNLRAGEHHNYLLQRDYKRHGEASFSFSIVELCAPVDCLEREQPHLDKNGTGEAEGSFNLHPRARSPRGIKRRPETIAKLRALASKEWVLTDPDGYEHEVTNLLGFCRERGLSQSALQAIAGGRGRTYKGWHCRYPGDPPPQPKAPRYLVTDPSGNTRHLVALYGFCRRHELDVSAMLKVAKGRQRAHKGWLCAFVS